MTPFQNLMALGESPGEMIMCDQCGFAIDPAFGVMIYLVRAKEGFSFFHAGDCARAARAEAGIAETAHPGCTCEDDPDADCWVHVCDCDDECPGHVPVA